MKKICKEKEIALGAIALSMEQIKENFKAIPTTDEIIANGNAMLNLAKAFSIIERGAE